MITARDVVILSTIDWGFLWQGHQEIAVRFVAAGNRVLFVENTGVRAPGLRDASRVVARLKNRARAIFNAGVRKDPSGVYVYSPVVLPPFGSSWRRALNRRIFLSRIRRAAKKLGFTDPVIWNYLPTDTGIDLIKMLRGNGPVVYYCVDNFIELSPRPTLLRKSEREILQMSDVVFATFSELGDKCGQWNDNVHIFPFGVDMEAFPATEQHRDASSQPVIGYVGGLHQHVDIGLLRQAIDARPDWRWIFVGALQTDVAELEKAENVSLLGQRPHNELVNHIRTFDVCIVPYVDSSYTATVVPTKINEYLALGKSVVSTRIPAVREFNAAFNVLRECENRVSDFLEQIEAALTELPLDEETIRYRRSIAERADWSVRLAEMCDLVMKGR